MVNNRMGKNNHVGIITFYHENYNFGGLLQAYALPNVLTNHFGMEAEQIDYEPIGELEKSNQPTNRSLIYEWVYRLGILFFRRIHKRHLQQRKHAFDRFMDEIPHSSITYQYDSIDQSLEQYDIFVCGGDQIWNDCGESRNIRIYTLQFVPPWVKKIAYAPSMAILDFSPDFETMMRIGMQQLHAVSVREKRAEALLRHCSEKPIRIVVDPVLLMTANEWNRVAEEPEKKGKYILCYLLGDNTEHRNAAKTIARTVRLPILTFPHILGNVVRKCDLFFGDIHDYTSGPREFLGLIQNAEFVITDSFHACAFSMIFQTPFAVFERHKADEKGNMNSRIYDFLEEYHLEDQLVTVEALAGMQEIPQVDFSYAHAHWEQRRAESLQYLENALKENENGAEP